jgi:ATP-dependent Clp protease ATP-binding subunit ClpC
MVVAEKTGVDVAQVNSGGASQFMVLQSGLLDRVKGQDGAVKTISERLKLAGAGLRDESRPMGVFIFLGPTGVGKTWLAECICDGLFGSTRNMIRIDMSEYMEQHSVARLVGSPPGYIGHDESGQLTGALRKHPYTVVLLDEVEKAHPNVWDIFLQVFDDGRLTDGKGKTVDASHAIFIMTSNIGARVEDSGPGIGFVLDESEESSKSDHIARYKNALANHFRPEFINRIDDVIIFNSLDLESIRSIALLELKKLSDRLEEREIDLKISNEALDHLIQEGFSPEFGARFLKRTVESLLMKPLSEKLLMGEIKAGETLVVGFEDGALLFGKK